LWWVKASCAQSGSISRLVASPTPHHIKKATLDMLSVLITKGACDHQLPHAFNLDDSCCFFPCSHFDLSASTDSFHHAFMLFTPLFSPAPNFDQSAFSTPSHTFVCPWLALFELLNTPAFDNPAAAMVTKINRHISMRATLNTCHGIVTPDTTPSKRYDLSSSHDMNTAITHSQPKNAHTPGLVLSFFPVIAFTPEIAELYSAHNPPFLSASTPRANGMKIADSNNAGTTINTPTSGLPHLS
jgi:hypothetical protein